ncbi:3TM-type holin [Thalassospira aquimaris]|uniref:3TM-type holin n=1 Tax=Thalassospira aquimaris TaxID=3037796 RepID=A0ABT6GGE7_9PROT|nr:3TM-type holin [Thalassospira sp. FZY0004]MDG4721138.1 3TM-type holin [Thalassospira sp. FZY0004]
MLPALGLLAPLASTLIDRLIPDKAEAEKAKAEIAAEVQKAEIDLAKSQMELAKEDAKTGRGGFRDWAGKLCIIALAYAWIVQPLLTWVIKIAAPDIELPPSIDSSEQYAMLTGMLGLAGVRSFDLVKGSRK